MGCWWCGCRGHVTWDEQKSEARRQADASLAQLKIDQERQRKEQEERRRVETIERIARGKKNRIEAERQYWLLPEAMTANVCPKCAYSGTIPTALSVREWSRERWGRDTRHSYSMFSPWAGLPSVARPPAYDVMVRTCPRCDANWIERPLDATPRDLSECYE